MDNPRIASINIRIHKIYVGAIQYLLIQNKLVGIGIKASRRDCIGAQGPNNPCCHITKLAFVMGNKGWTEGSRMVAEFFRTVRAAIAMDESVCHGSGMVPAPWVLSEVSDTFRLS
jgi:hypothetical protein